MFFVLRVVQLLRGMAAGMGVKDFSSAHQWRHLAEKAVHSIDAAGVVEPLELQWRGREVPTKRGFWRTQD